MDYEFTSEENKVISGIVVSARVAAGCIAATGVWKATAALRGGEIGGVVIAGCMFALVVLLWRASTAFDRIVKTEGADEAHLVAAFDELRKIFKGLRNVQILLLALIPLGILGGLVVAATHH